MFHVHLDCFQKPLLGGRPNAIPGDHGTPNAHNRCFILIYHVWGLTWIETHQNNIWLRAQSHMTSHYTWGPVTTLHDLRGVLGWPLDAFFWAPTISWSRLLALVWSGPKLQPMGSFSSFQIITTDDYLPKNLVHQPHSLNLGINLGVIGFEIVQTIECPRLVSESLGCGRTERESLCSIESEGTEI